MDPSPFVVVGECFFVFSLSLYIPTILLVAFGKVKFGPPTSNDAVVVVQQVGGKFFPTSIAVEFMVSQHFLKK